MAEVGAAVKAAIKPPKRKPEAAASSGSPLVVAKALLNPLKSLCRSGDANVHESARYLLMSLASRSGLARMRALFVIDYLFNRCKLFRQLVNEDISKVVDCCSSLVGAHRSASGSGSGIKAPDAYTAEIEDKVKELIEVWDLRHGREYPKLHCMARYLRESLRLVMPNVQASALSHLARMEANRALLLKKVLRRSEKVLRDELAPGCRAAEESIEQLEACFAVLFPSAAQSSPAAAADTAVSSAARAPSSPQGGDEQAVEWEDEQTVGADSSAAKDDEGGGDAVLFADGIAPFAMTIDLRQGLRGRDAVVLDDTIRELSSHLRRFVAPQLQSWQHALARGLRVYKDCAALSGGGGVFGDKGGAEVAAERLQTESALRSVALLLRRLNVFLDGRCKDFLDSIA